VLIRTILASEMKALFNKLVQSPSLLRTIPFAIFLGLTFCQGQFGEASRYWFYLAKIVMGAWMLWIVRPWIAEMRWAVSWEAIGVGVVVFAIWIGLDPFYPKLPGAGTPWNPQSQFGKHSTLATLFIGVRLIGVTLVVPPLEEVFYRSFVYRWIVNPDFQSVPLGRFAWIPFLVTSAVFGFEHHEWLAGILCGFAYQGLVCWKKRLGDAMTAHALTNFLLGVYVIWKGAWNFW
jgi:CAAX prenyl protease-like protein